MSSGAYFVAAWCVAWLRLTPLEGRTPTWAWGHRSIGSTIYVLGRGVMYFRALCARVLTVLGVGAPVYWEYNICVRAWRNVFSGSLRTCPHCPGRGGTGLLGVQYMC